jgi:hypothetical protein
MSVAVSVLPGPGGWESRAQVALDQLLVDSFATTSVRRLRPKRSRGRLRS